MSTITYKCDNCKRSIEFLENIHGITHIGKCTITKGCNGTLYRQSRNVNNIRTNIPSPRLDMQDYYPRNLFHKHVNDTRSRMWEVEHGMGLSCVFVAYDANSNIINRDAYTVNNNGSVAILQFNQEITGEVHVLARNDIATYDTANKTSMLMQVSYNNHITLAIPEYITRYDSDPTIVSPAFAPLNICGTPIRLEVEVSKPSEQPVYCHEELTPHVSQNGPWYGWNKILVRNRKHYCLYTLDLRKLRSMTPLYSTTSDIPDGTTIKLSKISYGDSEFYNIPDKGLLILLSKEPFRHSDKVLDSFVDCGEVVESYHPSFVFSNYEIFSNTENVESTYPIIRKSP